MLKALLLDLDGTLVDTPQAIIDVTQGTLAALGLPPADPQTIKEGIGLPLPVALGLLIGTGPTGAADAVEIYRVLWRTHVTPRIPQLLYPGVREGRHHRSLHAGYAEYHHVRERDHADVRHVAGGPPVQ